jgi:hypothetical protein
LQACITRVTSQNAVPVPGVWLPAVSLLFSAVVAISASPVAAAPADGNESAAKPAVNTVERLHSATTGAIQGTAARIDQFFVNDDHATFADNDTRVRLRFNLDYIQHHGWEASVRPKLQLVLRGLEERLRLVVNDGDSMDGDATSDADDENSVALRWIGKQTDSISYKFDVGLRIKSGQLDPFVRVNTGWHYPLAGKWQGQSSNRLYYYSRTGWRNDFRQYFEEKLSNPRLEQKFSLYHTIQDTSAIAYEVLWRRESAEDVLFDDDEFLIPPQKNYQQVQLRVRYRRSFWRPWLFFEVWPVVGWSEARDWNNVLGVRGRIELNFGAHGDLRLDE